MKQKYDSEPEQINVDRKQKLGLTESKYVFREKAATVVSHRHEVKCALLMTDTINVDDYFVVTISHREINNSFYSLSF